MSTSNSQMVQPKQKERNTDTHGGEQSKTLTSSESVW